MKTIVLNTCNIRLLRTLHVFLIMMHIYCVYSLKLTVLHTNDMHSHFEQTSATSGTCLNENSCYGGFARIRTAVNLLIKKGLDQNRTSIFLNAGDSFQGTPYYTNFKWEVVADIMNIMGFDVMSLGNHEFDDGVSGLIPYINNLTTPVVACNLDLSKVSGLISTKLPKSQILQINGTRIGVIGYLTPETMTLSSTGNVQIFEEIASIQKEATRLTLDGVKFLIALGHSGYSVDQIIAEKIPEIDLVVGGHSHTFLYTGTPPLAIDIPEGPYPTTVVQSTGKRVPVVQAYAFTKYLGYIELDIDDDGNLISYGGSPILLDNTYAQDQEVLQQLLPWKNKLQNIIHEKIGKTRIMLDQENRACRLYECNIGNLIADAFVDFNALNYTGTGWTDAAIGLIQGGGIRSSINVSDNNGTIETQDLMLTLPFNTNMTKLILSGTDLLRVLEHSVHRYEETITGHVGEFLQVSGLKVVYNLSAQPYERVVDVQVLCANCSVSKYSPLDLNATYGVLVPVYLVNGGDGYTEFGNPISSTKCNVTDYQMAKDYISRRNFIHPDIEGRITFISKSTASFCSKLEISIITSLLCNFILILSNY
uniref:5'-nucleotidase n=1 Tax=Clastoptera arizonana TaxID=38151 RepID=A0A1B6E0N6_9HEMI